MDSGGGSAGPSGPLTWNTEMMYNANGNITLRDDNAVAVFNTSTSHRCVYGSTGFNRGTHEWKVRVMQPWAWGGVGRRGEAWGVGVSVVSVWRSQRRPPFPHLSLPHPSPPSQVTVLNRPCCGYVGVASDGRLGTYDTFIDANTCVGINNFSGVRNAGSDAGTRWAPLHPTTPHH